MKQPFAVEIASRYRYAAVSKLNNSFTNRQGPRFTRGSLADDGG